MKRNRLSMHSSIACGANLRTYIRVAREAGFDCIEPTKHQLDRYFAGGGTVEELKELLGPIEISAVGWLADIERQGYRFVELMREAEAFFRLAAAVGSEAVEIINGPVDWHAVEHYRQGKDFPGYMGLQGLPMEEQEALTVKNLQALADLAKTFGLIVYFEPLCWTPIPSLKEGIPLIQRAGRDNLKIVVDFYHNFISGLDANFLETVDKNLIQGIHVCSAKRPDGSIPCEEIYRDVGYDDGAVPIREWAKAVKRTGFDGWWTYETFSRRELETEMFSFARQVRDRLESLVRT